MRRTGPTAKTCAVVMLRSAGRCIRCGTIGHQIHHRKPRQMGGTRDAAINNPANLVLLSNECHSHVESHRKAAYDEGWLVHRRDDPETVPLIDLFGQRFWLTDDSTVITNADLITRKGVL